MKNKEKQIVEMAEHCYNYHEGFCYADCENPTGCYMYANSECRFPRRKDCDIQQTFENLLSAGYRKQSEVAKEIFDEIERTFKGLLNGDISNILKLLSTLKKEYTEQKLDEPENRHVQCGELDRQTEKGGEG